MSAEDTDTSNMTYALADKVIQANAEEEAWLNASNKTPDGHYIDDLDQLVEEDIRKRKLDFARYVLARCRKLNQDLHVEETDGKKILYRRYSVVEDTPLAIAKLADLPESISPAMAAWVYRRLLLIVSPLDDSMIELVPGLLWDFNKAELIEMPTKCYRTI